jgi:hypothetical protein
MTLGTGEGATVIGLTCLGHQLCHGYERTPDLRRAKADVQRGQVRRGKPLLTSASRCKLRNRSRDAIKEVRFYRIRATTGKMAR